GRALNAVLENAIKFTDVGGILVKSTFEGGVLSICVRDTGIGFPKGEDPNSWSSTFVQAVPGCDERGGTGLGLSLARSMMVVQAGQLEIESIDDSSGYVTGVTLSLRADSLRGMTMDANQKHSPSTLVDVMGQTAEPTEASSQPTDRINVLADLDEDRIREAALSADLDTLTEVLGRIEAHDEHLAAELAPLLKNYDYQQFAQTLFSRVLA
ncbi:MAG: ATP-binding protein, partial [Pseudomonadota bacterium]